MTNSFKLSVCRPNTYSQSYAISGTTSPKAKITPQITPFGAGTKSCTNRTPECTGILFARHAKNLSLPNSSLSKKTARTHLNTLYAMMFIGANMRNTGTGMHSVVSPWTYRNGNVTSNHRGYFYPLQEDTFIPCINNNIN